MQFISIEQIQIQTNTSAMLNKRVVRIDLKSLITGFNRPKTFRYLKVAAYHRATALPNHAEPLTIYSGYVTPKDNNIRTVNNFVAAHISGSSGASTTWNPSTDIMFFDQYNHWQGEVAAMNDFYISFACQSVTVVTDEIITKILLGYDV